MDIYEYLKLDHKKVNKLFDLYESEVNNQNKMNIIAMFTKELLIHADSEAATFYKALEKDLHSKNQALHGEEEHEDIKAKLREISKFDKVNGALDEKVRELRKLVEHHVSDEEGKIFKAAKQVLSNDDALRLKEQMHYYKYKLMSKITDDQLATT